MTEQTCFYEVLGVAKDADDKALSKAKRSAARKWHPDKFEQKSEEEKKEACDKMAAANRAHDVLSDPDKRDAYDSGGFDALAALENGGAPTKSTQEAWGDIVDHFKSGQETAQDRIKKRQQANGKSTRARSGRPWERKRQQKQEEAVANDTNSAGFNQSATKEAPKEEVPEVVMIEVPSDVLQQVCDELRKDNSRTSLARKIETCMTRQGVKPGKKFNF